MSFEIVGVFLDVLVLVFLGAMIYYALRLSKSLSDFRQHRQEFDTVIIKLMSSIDQADRSIQNLKQVSAKESEDLNRLIRQSRALSEELQIINEAGENMAKRLEDVAEKNRKIAQGVDLSTSPSERYRTNRPVKTASQNQIQEPAAPHKAVQPDLSKPHSAPKDFPSFMVRDEDQPPPYPPAVFPALDKLEQRLESSASNDFPPPERKAPPLREAGEYFQSQAEKDLYNALRGNTKGIPPKGRS